MGQVLQASPVHPAKVQSCPARKTRKNTTPPRLCNRRAEVEATNQSNYVRCGDCDLAAELVNKRPHPGFLYPPPNMKNMPNMAWFALDLSIDSTPASCTLFPTTQTECRQETRLDRLKPLSSGHIWLQPRLGIVILGTMHLGRSILGRSFCHASQAPVVETHWSPPRVYNSLEPPACR